MRNTSIAVSLILLFALSGCGLTPAAIAKREANEKAREDTEKKDQQAYTQYLQAMAKIRNDSPVCVDEKDCKTKWEAAEVWVIKNSGFKIETSTNLQIETYTAASLPIGNSKNYALLDDYFSRLSASVLKEPIGGGKYKIIATISCTHRENSFGFASTRLSCVKDPREATLDFNKSVSSATN